ncbi:MAG TPA: energy transducer TonB [Thermodesulfobacteriota bacterium]|nr:energy transducer TonB [Thermodesulfobacteriota bacterium]
MKKVLVGSLLVLGVFVLALFLTPMFQPWLKTLTVKSKRILGLERKDVSPDEKRIREEVIFKKMEEGSLRIDWRALAPEYPRARSFGNLPEKEKMKALKETPEFKEMDREVKEYARKKEDLMEVDPPFPSIKEATDFTHLKDKGTEKAVQRLLGHKERVSQEKPLEENIRLGIKGPVALRKILERPPIPQVKVKVETEIEVTFWVLPDGMVDRAVPSVKGDSELERAAIQYLKQWRFIPLSKDQPQVEQWGTIPIQFKIQ